MLGARTNREFPSTRSTPPTPVAWVEGFVYWTPGLRSHAGFGFDETNPNDSGVAHGKVFVALVDRVLGEDMILEKARAAARHD